MSRAELIKVVERAVDDAAFRALLFKNPSEALKGYDLTDAERKELSGLNEGNFDDYAGPLIGRNTKGTWTPTP